MKKFLAVFLIAILAAIGCVRQDEMTTAVLPTNSATSMVKETTTSLATKTPQPTKTAVPTETPTFQPYATPTFFPVLTPSASADNFQLQSWDESAALNLVEKARNYANNEYEHHDDWYLKQVAYPEAQSLVELAIYEALIRYPETYHRQALEWQLAFAEAIQRKPEASQRLVSLLQAGFDNGDYTTSTLQSDIEKHNFHILETNAYSTPFPTSASNLFEHNQEASIFVISTNPGELGFNEGGVVLAISSQNAAPEVHYVDDFWSSGSGFFKKIIIEDTTGNEQNEVITILWDPNCYAHISVMEFQDNQFVELTNQSEPVPGNCRSSWNVYPSSENSNASLVATTSDFFFPTHVLTDTYQWQETKYIPDHQEKQIPKEITSQFIIFNGEYYDPREQLNLYDQLFWGSNNPMNTPNGAYSEMIKFRKAMLHIYLGEIDEGTYWMQNIAGNSNNLTPSTIAQSANVYLESFNIPSDSFRACVNTLQFLDEELGYDRPETYEEMEVLYTEKWGFAPYYQDEIICDLELSLETVVNHWNESGIAKETAVPDLLEQSGITPSIIETIDLDRDGDLDWLLDLELINFGKSSRHILVALIMSPDKILLLSIDPRFQNESSDSFELETIMLPGYSNPIHILPASERPKIFAIENDSGKPRIREWLDYSELFSLKQFQLSQPNGEFELVAFVEPNSRINSYSEAIYRWNPETQDFELVEKRADNSLGIPLDEAITQAETMILQEGDFEWAIPILTAVLTELNAVEELTYAIPRTRYLLGLAYELNNNETNAVHTYWELWQNYPESPYALLAQAKLEPKP